MLAAAVHAQSDPHADRESDSENEESSGEEEENDTSIPLVVIRHNTSHDLAEALESIQPGGSVILTCKLKAKDMSKISMLPTEQEEAPIQDTRSNMPQGTGGGGRRMSKAQRKRLRKQKQKKKQNDIAGSELKIDAGKNASGAKSSTEKEDFGKDLKTAKQPFHLSLVLYMIEGAAYVVTPLDRIQSYAESLDGFTNVE